MIGGLFCVQIRSGEKRMKIYFFFSDKTDVGNVFSKFFFFFLFSVCCDEIHVERGTELLGGGKIWPGTPNVVERVESGTTTTTKKKKKKKKRRRYYPPQLTPPFPLFPFFWPGSGNGGLDPSLLIIPVDTVNAKVSHQWKRP
jgi:hypothetical protein